jgi:hypothetical protein
MELSNSNTALLWAVAGGSLLGVSQIAHRIDEKAAATDKDAATSTFRTAPVTLGKYVAGAIGIVCFAFAARLIYKDNSYY